MPYGPALPRVLILCGPGIMAVMVGSSPGTWMLGGLPSESSGSPGGDQLRGDAAVQWAILDKSGVEQIAWHDADGGETGLNLDRLAPVIADADWLVDGLLGTGLSPRSKGLFVP